MKETFYILTIILLLTSCKEKKRIVEKIDFKTVYKFSSEIEDQITKDTVFWKYQISASDYAIKGDYKNALIQWDSAMGTSEKNFTEAQTDSIKQKYSKLKATDYIIEEAEKNQIVIINEAHHNSFHRVFTKTLLKKLYDIGYTNFGLETLSHEDTLLNNRKYPIIESGYYSKDPQFGNLIRKALEIGYTIFPYETKNSGNGIESREKEQAKNIQNIIESKPNEKFLIYCGFGHNVEGVHPSWGNTMASILTEYTGINPVTINQVAYSEKSNPKFNNPLLKVFNIKEPSILIDKDKNPLRYERGSAWSDIAVFHPNTLYIDNRPNWLFENGNKNVSISLTDIQIQFPVMVLAFKKGEDINLAVPVDITEVKNGAGNCNLGLETGIYNIVITNGKDSVKFEQNVD